MPLAPSKYYHFEQTWPSSGPRVIMTPMKVWHIVGCFFIFLAEVIFLV